MRAPALVAVTTTGPWRRRVGSDREQRPGVFAEKPPRERRRGAVELAVHALDRVQEVRRPGQQVLREKRALGVAGALELQRVGVRRLALQQRGQGGQQHGDVVGRDA
ncbi:MAG: hypothetical protein P8Z81_12180, partial [Deinococcales bacterium]